LHFPGANFRNVVIFAFWAALVAVDACPPVLE